VGIRRGGAKEFGSATAASLSPDVARRVARLDGWLTRPTATLKQILAEHALVHRQADAIGHDLTGFELAHVNFGHLVDAGREAALAEQAPIFASVLGTKLPFERLRELHWTGSLDDVAAQIAHLVDAGVRHVVFHPLRPDPDQVDLWVEGVLGRLGARHNDAASSPSPASD